MTPEERAALAARIRENGNVVQYADVPSEGEQNGGLAQNFVESLGQRGIAQALGAAQGFTLNTAPAMSKGFRSAPGLAGLVAAGSNAASAILTGGKPALGSEQEMFDQYAEDYPMNTLMGDIAGTVGGVVLGGKAGLPALPEKVGALGRMGAASVAGALEGGVSERAAGGDAQGGAVLGGLTGLGLQGVVGELGVPAMRWLGDTGASKRAVEAFQNMSMRLTGHKDFPKDYLLQKRFLAGDKAALIDIPEFGELAKTILYDPRLVDSTRDLNRMLVNRLDRVANPGATVREEFAAQAKTTLPTMFDHAGVIISEPRALDQVMADIKVNQKKIQASYDAVLDPLNTVPIPKSWFNQAIEESFGTGRSGMRAKGIMERHIKDVLNRRKPDPASGSASGFKYINPRDLQNIRIELQDDIRKQMKAGNVNTARQLIAMKDHITDDVLGKIPGYAEANAAYRSEAGYGEAYELGRKVFNMSVDDLDSLPLNLKSFERGDLQGFLEGFARSMVVQLDDTVKTGREINKVTGSEAMQRALKLIMPAKQADQFIKEANTALMMHNTATKLTGGSQTAARTAEGLANDPSSQFRIAQMLGGILNRFVPGAGTSSAGALGAASTELRRTNFSPKQAEIMGTMLQASGAKADETIKALAINELPSYIQKSSTLDQLMENNLLTNAATYGGLGGTAARQEQRTPYNINQRRTGPQ